MVELIGFILPPLIDLINKKISNSKTRFVVSFLTCVGVGVGMNYGKLNVNSLGEVLGAIGVVFASAQVAYKLYWEKSSLRKRLQ